MRRRSSSFVVVVVVVSTALAGCGGGEGRAKPKAGKQVVVARFPPEFIPRGVAVDGKGTVYTSGWDGKRFVLAAFPKKGKPSRRPIPCATSEGFYDPVGANVVATPEGVLFWSMDRQNRVVRINPDGSGDCYAGTGEPGFSGDGGPAISAKLDRVRSLTYDPERKDLYLFDSAGSRVRRIDAAGTITTVVEPGGMSGDGLVETNGIAFDGRLGRLYVRTEAGIAYRTRDAEVKVIPDTEVSKLYLEEFAVDPTSGDLVATGEYLDTFRTTRRSRMIRINADGMVLPVPEWRLQEGSYAGELSVDDLGSIWIVTNRELVVIRPRR